jgi:hypothetical protein
MPAMWLARRRTPRRYWVSVLLTFVMVIPIAPTTARAAGKDAKERAAMTACLSGDHTKGVALLAEMYVSTRDAIYIFNQGRCFEQNGRYEEAIVRFREFQLKNTDAGRAPDAEADRHIAKCQAFLDKQKPEAPTPSPSEIKPAVEPAPAPAPLPSVSSARPEPAPVAAPPQPEPAPAASVPQPEPRPVAVPIPVPAPTPEAISAPAALVSQPSLPEPTTESHPFYKTWWFWTAVGTAVAAGAVTAFLLTRSAPNSCDDLDMKCVGIK